VSEFFATQIGKKKEKEASPLFQQGCFGGNSWAQPLVHKRVLLKAAWTPVTVSTSPTNTKKTHKVKYL